MTGIAYGINEQQEFAKASTEANSNRTGNKYEGCDTNAIVESRKTVHDMGVRNIGIAVMCGTSARMENGPGGAPTPYAGTYHAPIPPEIEGEVSPILPILDGLTDAEHRERLIGMLDDVRHAYESARFGRLQLMVTAYDSGVSCHDIGVVLGITENAVRQQIKRTRAGA